MCSFITRRWYWLWRALLRSQFGPIWTPWDTYTKQKWMASLKKKHFLGFAIFIYQRFHDLVKSFQNSFTTSQHWWVAPVPTRKILKCIRIMVGFLSTVRTTWFKLSLLFEKNTKKKLVMHFCRIYHPKNLKVVKVNYSQNRLFIPVPKRWNQTKIYNTKERVKLSEISLIFLNIFFADLLFCLRAISDP